MRSWHRSTRAAFTLIELMIVVAIVGILAVLAIYSVRKYIANAKTTEARNVLGRLADAAVIEFEHEKMAGPVLALQSSSQLSRALCKSASQSVPAVLASISGRKYQSSIDDWNVDGAGNSGFACLHFTIDAPQYYMYSYRASGSSQPGNSFIVMANGDLNADGIASTFSLMGSINSSYVMNLAPNILEILPEE
jgi:type IV pilus assembly protein PilA